MAGSKQNRSGGSIAVIFVKGLECPVLFVACKVQFSLQNASCPGAPLVGAQAYGTYIRISSCFGGSPTRLTVLYPFWRGSDQAEPFHSVSASRFSGFQP